MSTDFTRILNYCAALDAHNERTWFHENHKWYEQARKDYLGLLDFLRLPMMQAAPKLSDDIMFMQPKDWMYRVARDMRYYRDKPPYDPAFRAYVARNRKSWMPIGYYIRIFPGSSCFGTGLWCENTATTNKIRDYISENLEEFEDIYYDLDIPLTGDKLKKMPRGYADSNPAAEWIKFKNWEMIVEVPDERLTTYEEFADYVSELIIKMEPMRLFLLEAAKQVGIKQGLYL